MDRQGNNQIIISMRGLPVAQGRPRSSVVAGHVHVRDDDRSRDFKAALRYAAQEEAGKIGWTIPESPYMFSVMSIALYMPVPKRWPKYRQRMALDGVIRPTSKPDVDNLAKSIMDALSGVWYMDDKDISELKVTKHYGAEARYTVSLYLESAEVLDLHYKRGDDLRIQEIVKNNPPSGRKP